MEMIKGIQGHGYHDELVVPIIENAAHERELIESLTEALLPKNNSCPCSQPWGLYMGRLMDQCQDPG